MTTTTKRTKLSSPTYALATRLRMKVKCPCIRDLRERCSMAITLGEVAGLIRLLHYRRERRLDKGDAWYELQEILALAWKAAHTPVGTTKIINAWERAGSTADGAEARMEAVRQAAAAREAERRRHDPHAQLRASLERAAMAPTAAAPRTHSRRARGECGAKLAQQIDAELTHIKAREDESTWPPFQEFPWELAHQTLAEVQAESSIPDGLGALLAEVLTEQAEISFNPPVTADLVAEIEEEDFTNVIEAAKTWQPMGTEFYKEPAPPAEPAPAPTKSAWDLLPSADRQRIDMLCRVRTALQGVNPTGQVDLAAKDVMALLQGQLLNNK